MAPAIADMNADLAGAAEGRACGDPERMQHTAISGGNHRQNEEGFSHRIR